MTEKLQTDEAETIAEARSLLRDIEEIVERVVYAVIGCLVTYLAASMILNLETEQAKEVALLNGALAYYSHAATGRVVRVLYALAKNVAVAHAAGRVPTRKQVEKQQ